MIERQYLDIDQQAACLTDYDQKYQQISRGRYRGHFKTAILGSAVGLYFETFNQVLDQWGAAPEGHYGFIFLMNDDGACRLRGQHISKDHLIYLTPGADFDCHCEPGVHFGVISIEERFFNYFLRACVADAGERFFDTPITFVENNALRCKLLRQSVNQALDLIDSAGELQDKSKISAGLQMSLSGLLASFVADQLVGMCAPDKRLIADNELIAERALMRIRDDPASVSVESLAVELQVSRRQLEYAFRTRFDVAPAQYIRVVRLNNVRSRLRDTTQSHRSIGDIAADMEFWHLSHFARNYYHQFGELPSQTRQML